MSKSNKAKTVGKCVVVLLCAAIVFFLLLPFLETSAPAVSSEQGKKASPQIFTSNPLSELVRKVYSLFAGKQKQPKETPPALYAEGEIYPPEQESTEIRYAGTEYLPAEQADPSSTTTSYFPENYDYDDARFINEEGEWVLVQQTAPEAAQRGMHDINASDSAYDKLVRLERAAKYTAGPAPKQPAIPDSKWARLFNPIKSFFGIETPSAAQTRPLHDAQAWALASSEGIDYSRRRPTERFASGSLNMGKNTSSGPDNAAAAADTPAGMTWSDILDPSQALERLKELENRWYSPEKGQTLSPADKKRYEAALRVIARKQNQFRQQRVKQIQEDAAGQQSASIFNTFSSCSGDSMSSYQTSASTQCPSLTEEEKRLQQEQEMQQARQAGQRSIQNLTEALGFAPPPLNVILVLGKEKAQYQPESDAMAFPDAEGLTKEYYAYLTDSKCPEGDCYWIGAGKDAEALVTAMGGELYPDPLGVAQNSLQTFKEYKLKQAKEAEQSEEEIQILQQQLDSLSPAYTAYNTAQWQQLQPPAHRPQEGQQEAQVQVKPSIFITPTAPNASSFIEDARMPAMVFYDKNNQALNADSSLSSAQQGEVLAAQVVTRVKELQNEMKELESTLARMRLDGVLEEKMEEANKKWEEMKKEWERLRANSPQ